jgi:hypothetical protein
MLLAKIAQGEVVVLPLQVAIALQACHDVLEEIAQSTTIDPAYSARAEDVLTQWRVAKLGPA